MDVNETIFDTLRIKNTLKDFSTSDPDDQEIRN